MHPDPVGLASFIRIDVRACRSRSGSVSISNIQYVRKDKLNFLPDNFNILFKIFKINTDDADEKIKQKLGVGSSHDLDRHQNWKSDPDRHQNEHCFIQIWFTSGIYFKILANMVNLLIVSVGDPWLFGADPYLWLMDTDPTPDPISSVTFKDSNKIFFFSIFSPLSSVIKIHFLDCHMGSIAGLPFWRRRKIQARVSDDIPAACIWELRVYSHWLRTCGDLRGL